MELQFGDFLFRCDTSVAVVIFAFPAMLLMQLPVIQRTFRKGVIWYKRRKKKQNIF